MQQHVVLIWIFPALTLIQATVLNRPPPNLNCPEGVECNTKYPAVCNIEPFCDCLPDHHWSTHEDSCVPDEEKLEVISEESDDGTFRKCVEWVAVVLSFIFICSLAGLLLRLIPLPTGDPCSSTCKLEMKPPPTYEEIEISELPSYMEVTQQKLPYEESSQRCSCSKDGWISVNTSQDAGPPAYTSRTLDYSDKDLSQTDHCEAKDRMNHYLWNAVDSTTPSQPDEMVGSSSSVTSEDDGVGRRDEETKHYPKQTISVDYSKCV